MSLDVIAIVDVARPVEPVSLKERLASEPALAALVDRFGEQWTITEWAVEPSTTDPRVVDLVGPGGIVVRLGSRCAEVYHLLPFRSFAKGGPDQRMLRKAIRAIARLVGSSRALYTHELAPVDRDPDRGVDHTIENLARNVGPPSATFEELARAEHYRAGCWLVDEFADLDAS